MAQILRYPSTLNSSNQTPQNFVRFTPYAANDLRLGADISLYCPPSHRISDGASYNNFDLGIFGGAIGQGAGNLMAADQGEGDARNANLGNAIKSQIGGMKDGGMKAAVLSKAFSNFGLGGQVTDRVRDLYLQNQGRAINPNTVLQFTNTTIRSFGFTFKMVAESQAESVTIKEITNTFRKYLYPVKEEFTLQYPPKWKISFHKPSGDVNEYIPKIYDSYLENMSVTINSNGSSFHYDGAPIEVDVSLTFKEVKALARGDIEGLQ